MKKKYKDLSEKYIENVVETVSGFIQIPSKSGKEKEYADAVADTMRKLEYDEITVDRCGNVIGKMKGTGGGKSVVFCCHLDIVDEGDIRGWNYPPFEGKVADGKVWGRGASDTKGAFAVQIYTPYILKKEGLLTKGDIYVVCVVHEETCGYGAMNLIKDGFHADYAIVGEATENNIAISCKGRVGIEVLITGKSCHASIPETGVNPFFYLGKFLDALKHYEHAHSELYGSSLLSPTKITSSEIVTNTVPASLILSIDYRSIPGETYESMVERLRKVTDSCLYDGISVDVKIITFPLKTYTGIEEEVYQAGIPFGIEANHTLVRISHEILEDTFENTVQIKNWPFCTDCGHFTGAGIPTIGYAPAEIKYCHTTNECIDIEMMKNGLAGNIALAEQLSNIEEDTK